MTIAHNTRRRLLLLMHLCQWIDLLFDVCSLMNTAATSNCAVSCVVVNIAARDNQQGHGLPTAHSAVTRLTARNSLPADIPMTDSHLTFCRHLKPLCSLFLTDLTAIIVILCIILPTVFYVILLSFYLTVFCRALLSTGWEGIRGMMSPDIMPRSQCPQYKQ